MEIRQFRRFLLDRGMVYFYAIFVAGYFLLPMASGHRRLYYILVLPAVLLLGREIYRFYRGNALCLLLHAYCGYMLLTLLWTADFQAGEALLVSGYSLALLSFCLVTGFLWIQYPQRMDQLGRRALLLAAAAALVSTVAWYLDHPFPSSRLQPLGVMHHENKAGCAYGLFLVLSLHHVFHGQRPQQRPLYILLGVILLSLVLLTQSRTALAASCAAMLILLGWRALGIVALGLAVSWILVSFNPDEWWHRVEQLSFRPAIWQQLLGDMQGHWWFGKGLLVDPQVRTAGMVFNHAHNSYLASLRDGGAIGLGLMLAMLALAGLWAWRLYRERGERLYLALLIYAMTCVFMDFDRLLVHPKELWLFFWLPIALIMAVYPHRDDPGLVRYPVKTS